MASQDELQEIANIRDLIRAAGMRCTAARIAVLRRLRQRDAPVTHAELAEDLVPQGYDKATVYRNLMDLTDAGLVHRAELGDHVWRFELRGDSHDGGEHPHFVCVDCGSVTCMTDVKFDQATRRRAARLGDVTEILLKGRCKGCR